MKNFTISGIVGWMFCCALLLSLGSFIPYEQGHQRLSQVESNAFADRLLDRVTACVQHGDAFSANKPEMLHLIQALKDQRAYLESGSDDFRVKFVGTQGVIEHVLAWAQALGEIEQLVGVIHTPMPATPLCIRPDEDPSVGLLDASMAHDIDKQMTVRSRAQIVREYLHKGGRLYVAYPRGGLERRSAEQQAIYHEALAQFPGAVVDCVLNSDYLAADGVGATYLFRDFSGQVYAFSIKSTQANDAWGHVEWGIWFGPVTDSEVRARINGVFDYLDYLHGPDIRSEFDLKSTDALSCDRCGGGCGRCSGRSVDVLACDRCGGGHLNVLCCDRCGGGCHRLIGPLVLAAV